MYERVLGRAALAKCRTVKLCLPSLMVQPTTSRPRKVLQNSLRLNSERIIVPSNRSSKHTPGLGSCFCTESRHRAHAIVGDQL